MVKNECGQSDLWTLKLTVSQEKSDGTNWFFACLYNFTQIKRWLKMGVKNGCGQSGDGTLNLTVLAVLVDERNWLFAFDMWSQKLKADQKLLWVRMVKNGCGQCGQGTQKWTDGIKSFFYAGMNSGMLKVDSVIFGWAWSKMALAF